jgi:hypothetical protein
VTICDGRDDILGRKPDSKNTVTIVTTDTEEVANILFPTSSPAGRKGAFDLLLARVTELGRLAPEIRSGFEKNNQRNGRERLPQS